MKTIFDYLVGIAGKQNAKKTPCDVLLVNALTRGPSNTANDSEAPLLRTYYSCYLDKPAGEIYQAYSDGVRVMVRHEYPDGVEFDSLISAAIVEGQYFFSVPWEGDFAVFSAPSAEALPEKRNY